MQSTIGFIGGAAYFEKMLYDNVQLSVVPLLQGRELIDGLVAAYVCCDFVCHTPVTEPEELWAQLGPH